MRDSIPYPSACFPQSSPAHLHAVARVFGLTPVDLTQAKVLEIGCASGGNLLPLAARFPEAGFTGIDLPDCARIRFQYKGRGKQSAGAT